MCCALALATVGWGSFEDLSFKVKPGDGALWGDLHGGGELIIGREARPQLMFTFDDGPDHRTTPLLLDHLDRYGVKAIFFVNGHRMHEDRDDSAENIETLRQIHRRGHIIGNHTFSHRDLTSLTPSELEWQIDGLSKLVSRVTGKRTWVFRPPFGKMGAAWSHLTVEGYTTVMWTMDPLDWQTEDPTEVLSRFVSCLAENPEGGIVDLHDTNRATVEAFPLIMEWLEQRNAELAAKGEPVYRIVGLEAFYRERGKRR